jgi:hypothetical protein
VLFLLFLGWEWLQRATCTQNVLVVLYAACGVCDQYPDVLVSMFPGSWRAFLVQGAPVLCGHVPLAVLEEGLVLV